MNHNLKKARGKNGFHTQFSIFHKEKRKKTINLNSLDTQGSYKTEQNNESQCQGEKSYTSKLVQAFAFKAGIQHVPL